MNLIIKIFGLFLLLNPFLFSKTLANPHWNQMSIPLDSSYSFYKDTKFYADWRKKVKKYRKTTTETQAIRITVRWNQSSNTYSILEKFIENTATPALKARSKKESPYGSFKAKITDVTNDVAFYDSIGTGEAYKRLVKDISFRFPFIKNDFQFSMTVENSLEGNQETVLSEVIKISELSAINPTLPNLEIFSLKEATQSPSLEFVFYAEGYATNEKQQFFSKALASVDILKNMNIPYFNNMNFVAVFAGSNQRLGRATNLGFPVVQRDSAFGLYFPYWYNFGRWYNVIYPTDENYFRTSLAVVPYDYNVIIVKSSEYWGVGNYKTHTAIPSDSSSYIYLLLHEFGHFLGLNEEYDGGGATELQFAQNIREAWSQNMTFLPEMSLIKVKWSSFITDLNTPIPTPSYFWQENNYGVYSGGYGDSNGLRSTYKPGLSCTMESGQRFCPICMAGMADVIRSDLGL